MQRANHEIAAGPQEPKDDRPKVLGNQMQDGKSPCSSLRGKSVSIRARHAATFPVRMPCPFRSPHRWTHAGAHHSCVVVNGLAAASFAVKQAVVFAESDSARLTICTGALCHRQPAFCDTPLPNDRSLATGMQCSRQYVRVGCRSEPLQNSGLRWHLIRPLSLNKCATHITAILPQHPIQGKKLYASLQLCVSVVPKNKASDPRIQARHASFLGALKSACVPDFRLLSRTWLIYQKHLLNLAAFILAGRNALSIVEQSRQYFWPK